ncbi:helix-turn-helix domain-containing protein [Amycolatopsis australiensis]|uniref:helix-turn-helix domain-containing protein n=1 Tax=Amycolatopsis australiensis TaxID=546364 RepID=UPI0015A56450|nr:helix-turn-helix transcriptional regulator [Amycolatopsis australiensis]
MAPSRAGRLLKAYRQRSGLSQREAADAAGISLGGLRDIERARSSAQCPQWTIRVC